MRDLDSLIKDGFYVSEVRNNRGNIADYSLLGSLKSYFSTAEDLTWYMANKDLNIEMKGLLLGSYAVDACNAITQFQHFFELLLKDILLEHNRLLVYDVSRKPELLIKLINNNEDISDAQLEKMNFIECSMAIDRVKALNDAKKLDSKYQFIVNYFDLFKKLNNLRNSIVHRGAFIINPLALDEIFGRYVIPFVNKLDDVSNYGSIKSIAFNLDSMSLNPFYAIAEEYNNTKAPKVNENKIHLYKLIGAAAYKNKIDFVMDAIFGDYDVIREKAEKNAESLAEQNHTKAEKCPVCGCKSFVREIVYDEDKDDCYVSKIGCDQCGFHIENWLLEKMKDMNIPLNDYSQWC